MNKDEVTLRAMIAEWHRAFEQKDIPGLVKDYQSDVLLFDCKPPYKTEGKEAVKQLWEQCLPYFPDTFSVEKQEEKLVVDGNMAYLHALHRIRFPDNTHPACQTWLRVTVVYHKTDGAWKVAHEHVSIPFNPFTNQAAFITDLNDVFCGVDYANACKA